MACGRGPSDDLLGQQTICLTCCPFELSNSGGTLHRAGRAWGSRRILAAAEAGPTVPSTPTASYSAGTLPSTPTASHSAGTLPGSWPRSRNYGSRPQSRNYSTVKSGIALESASAQASHTAALPRRLFTEAAVGRPHAQRRRGRRQAWSSQPPSPKRTSNPGPRACGKELPVDSSPSAVSDEGVRQLHFDMKLLGELRSRMATQGSSQEIRHLGALGYAHGDDHDQQQHEQQQRQQQQQTQLQPQLRPQLQAQPRPSSVPLPDTRIPRQGMERPLKEIQQLGKFRPRSVCRSRSGLLPARLPPSGWEFPCSRS